jgi:hypothetical protein
VDITVYVYFESNQPRQTGFLLHLQTGYVLTYSESYTVFHEIEEVALEVKLLEGSYSSTYFSSDARPPRDPFMT